MAAGTSTTRRQLTVETLEGREVPTVVTQWNRAVLDAIRVDRTAPPVAARNLAILHLAVFDAVNSIRQEYRSYRVNIPVAPDTSEVAAASTAAFRVARQLFPNQVPQFQALQERVLSRIPPGMGLLTGQILGRVVANRMLNWRANDGANAVVAYTPGSEPGDWQPTPAAFGRAVLPQWPRVTTFAVANGSQFQPPGPPALTSTAYTRDFNEVKDIGSANSTTRTADQTQIALFWSDDAGTATPPGHWNVIGQGLARRTGLDVAEEARLFALLNVSLADAGICCWDAKYDENFWRPITAIRSADRDGNPDTTADAAWWPLIATPAFPSYTSGHSTFSSAAATVLRRFFGRDMAFSTTSEGLPGVVRSFRSFDAAADEAGRSRIYGGIHYQFDNVDAQVAGRGIGNLVMQKLLRPIR